jgi:hypothetical protein
MEEGKMRSIGWMTFRGDEAPEYTAIAALLPKRAAFERLSRRYMARSIPQLFR